MQAHDARLLAHVRLTPPQCEQDGGELAAVVGLILLDGEGLADVERRVVTEEDAGAGGGVWLTVVQAAAVRPRLGGLSGSLGIRRLRPRAELSVINLH